MTSSLIRVTKHDMFALKARFFFRFACISILFFFQTFYLSSHHFWRDEAQAWLISSSAQNFPDLLEKLRYEGHPPLWYLLIIASNYFFDSLQVLKVIQFITNLWFCILLFTDKKLSTFHIIAIGLSFYILLGYSTVSRPYMLGVCLMYQSVRFYERSKPGFGAILLMLAVASHVLFVPVAIGLFFFYLNKIRSVKTTKFRFGLVAVFTSNLILNYQIIRPKHDSSFQFRTSVGIDTVPELLRNFIDNIFFPMTLISQGQLLALSLLAGLFLAAISLYLLNVHRLLFLGFLFMLFLYLTNYLVGYQYAWWHFGVIYLSILLYLRVGYSEINKSVKPKTGTKTQNLTAFLFFIISIFSALDNFQGSGILMLKAKNYSNSSLVADYIDKNCKDSCTIVQDNDYSGAGISALLGGRVIYYLNTSKFGTYTVWNKRPFLSAQDKVKLFTDLALQDCILIKEPSSVEIYPNTNHMFTTSGAIQSGEDFEVRRCTN